MRRQAIGWSSQLALKIGFEARSSEREHGEGEQSQSQGVENPEGRIAWATDGECWHREDVLAIPWASGDGHTTHRSKVVGRMRG